MDCPPLYKDLGKAARDLFAKGFNFGAVKLDVKTRSQSGFEVRASGSNNTDTGISGGHLETRYALKDPLGLSFKHRWNTENRLETEVSVEPRLARGVRLGLSTTFVPNTGKKSATVRAGYRCSYVNAGVDVDAAAGGPRVHAAGVLGYQGLLAGYQMTFDAAAQAQPTRHDFSLGFRAGDFQLLTSVNDGTEFNTSVYQRVSADLQTAAGLTWTVGSDSSRLGLAARYRLDRDVTLSAKVDNVCLVGLGYTQSLRPGVKFTVSALIDGKNFNAGGHKVGMGFEFEA